MNIERLRVKARPGERTSDRPSAPSNRPRAAGDVIPFWLLIVLGLLLLQRVAYHATYLAVDPFAYVTISDGQLYERAARDILAHPPFGSEPFYLQGLYAYVLAAGMALSPNAIAGLIVQLVLAGLGVWAFGDAARRVLGQRAGGLSWAVLLAAPSVAFYENKYLSVSIGITTCCVLIWAYVRFALQPSALRAGLLGGAAGLCVLGRPNLALALPFVAIALWLGARRSRWDRAGLLLSAALGCALALAPMGLRNWVVTGRPQLFPSHGGGIPFYIGNNPAANGRWNDAGGLLSGQVMLERQELARRLQLPKELDGAALDDAIGGEMYRRGLRFIADQPGTWLKLELNKLRYTLGNHAFVRDYDLLGERELLGFAHPVGLPFGVVLGLGVFGLALLIGAARQLGQPAHLGLCVLLVGLLAAVLLANLLWFTSAQNRAPLYIPLAFSAGPAIESVIRRWRRVPGQPHPPLPRAPLALALLLCLHAFIPTIAPDRPSSTHYFNLANAEEALGRNEAALAHYAIATERNPRQPIFWWRRASLAWRMRRADEARASLDKLIALPGLPPDLRAAAEQARGATTPPR